MISLSDILDEFNIDYKKEREHHHVSKDFIGVDCPYCCSPGDEKYRLGWNIPKKYFFCWVCGYKPTYPTIKDLLNTNSQKTKEICGQLAISFYGEAVASNIKKKLVIPDGLLTKIPEAHRLYLKKRKIDPEYLEKVWNIRYTMAHPSIPWRVWIPILNKKGITVSWTTRSVLNSKSRYKNASVTEESEEAKKLLFGEHHVKSHKILIHEGPFDVFKVGPGAVCTFGLKISESQILKISKYPVRYICLDNQPEAETKAKIIADQLSVHAGKTFVVHLDSKDAGEGSDKELQQLRKLIL